MHTHHPSHPSRKLPDSPITADCITHNTLSFSDLHVTGNTIYWLENRSGERGRGTIMSCPVQDSTAKPREETPSEFHVSTDAHGYGGGAFYAGQGLLIFSEGKTGVVFYKDLDKNDLRPLTISDGCRFACFYPDPQNRFLYCIRSNRKSPSHSLPPTELVRIDIASCRLEVLFSDAGFYTDISVSPDGKHLCWLQWNHPHMPWDETELWMADIEPSSAAIHNARKLLGETGVSLFQPSWSPDGMLYVCSDRLTGYWNLHRFNSEGSLVNLLPLQSDCGRPMWIAGTRTYAFTEGGRRILCCHCEKGIWKLTVLDSLTGNKIDVNHPFTTFHNIAAEGENVAYIGGHSYLPASIATMGISLPVTSLHVIRQSFVLDISPDLLPKPQHFEIPTRDGETCHAFYYPPTNHFSSQQSTTLPPLILRLHGGPTTADEELLSPKIAFLTSQGFARVDVNYRGSTGYGRKYREKLKGKWGIIDVDDGVDTALYLCAMGKADRKRLAITGSSSGGYGVLQSLVRHPEIYTCASCHYGIADLKALAENTHKLEAFYDRELIGGENPQDSIYRERSPLFSSDKIKTPIIFFHGDRDPVVDCSQTHSMAAALEKNGVYVEKYILPGEGHGFKMSDNQKMVLTKELEFFKKFLTT